MIDVSEHTIHTILFYIIIVFHTSINIFLLFSPYVSNNIYYLVFILSWYILHISINSYLGYCFVTHIEHNLRPDLVESKNCSFTQNTLSSFIGKRYANIVFFSIPIINISVILYKIWNHYKLEDEKKEIYENAIEDKIWML